MNSTEELAWFKSSHSDGEGGACLEVAYGRRNSTIHIRDSKQREAPHLTVTPSTWTAFVAYART